ncbi:hypothetical protein BsWGS_23029 [Bradybaena similaris]
MEETENDYQFVETLTALKVKQADSHSPVVDVVTVDRGTRSFIHKGNTITIASREKEKRNSQIEASIEIIMKMKDNEQKPLPRAKSEQQPTSHMNGSCGIVLDPDMISLGGENTEAADGFIKVGRVLGKGNSSGEVIVVKDRVTEKEVAYKTILVSHFNGDEIRAWVRLGDEGKAPKLYHFRLVDGNVEVSMEPLSGLTVEEVTTTDWWIRLYEQGHGIIEKLSLCVLDDLLGIYDRLKPYSHSDLHAGNVILENSMAVKLIDFGKATNLLKLEPLERGMTLRNDLVGIIRIFCALYSGVDFNDLWDAKKQLSTNDLSQLSECMEHIPEASRKALFKIMSMLYDTVRDSNPNQEGFGDTSDVAKHIKPLLPEDVEMFKKKVAVILFPEKYQIEVDGVDSSRYQLECDGVEVDGEGDVFTWDSLYMDYCVKNVTLKDLQTLDESLFFHELFLNN